MLKAWLSALPNSWWSSLLQARFSTINNQLIAPFSCFMVALKPCALLYYKTSEFIRLAFLFLKWKLLLAFLGAKRKKKPDFSVVKKIVSIQRARWGEGMIENKNLQLEQEVFLFCCSGYDCCTSWAAVCWRAKERALLGNSWFWVMISLISS